jgi:Na+/proline symporter
LMVFMACTSGFSADVVSISAVWTYDIYGSYSKPCSLLKLTYPNELTYF